MTAGAQRGNKEVQAPYHCIGTEDDRNSYLFLAEERFNGFCKEEEWSCINAYEMRF